MQFVIGPVQNLTPTNGNSLRAMCVWAIDIPTIQVGSDWSALITFEAKDLS